MVRRLPGSLGLSTRFPWIPSPWLPSQTSHSETWATHSAVAETTSSQYTSRPGWLPGGKGLQICEGLSRGKKSRKGEEAFKRLLGVGEDGVERRGYQGAASCTRMPAKRIETGPGRAGGLQAQSLSSRAAPPPPLPTAMTTCPRRGPAGLRPSSRPRAGSTHPWDAMRPASYVTRA